MTWWYLISLFIWYLYLQVLQFASLPGLWWCHCIWWVAYLCHTRIRRSLMLGGEWSWPAAWLQLETSCGGSVDVPAASSWGRILPRAASMALLLGKPTAVEYELVVKWNVGVAMSVLACKETDFGWLWYTLVKLEMESVGDMLGLWVCSDQTRIPHNYCIYYILLLIHIMTNR